MNDTKFNSFKEFYPFYLSEHSKKSNKILHMIGSILDCDFKSIYLSKREGDIDNSLADITLAKVILSYNPKFNFRLGLEKTIKKYKR